ncbi:MAG: hypothetical protein SFU83_23995 [Meiothermus sp.]|nr:hypothetical protein [Meiothermus sp.]
MSNPHKRSLATIALLALLAACGNPTPAPGTLEVILNLSQAPGITPDVLLKGPDGSEKVITASLTDPQAKTGDYSLVVKDVTVGGYLSKVSASETSFKLEPGGSKSVDVSYQTWGKANLTLEMIPTPPSFSPTLTLTRGGVSKNLTASGAVDLEPGTYAVTASDAPANYTRTLSTTSLVVTAGQTANLTLRFERNSGIALGATGLPNGATVYATPTGGGTPITATYNGGNLNLVVSTPGTYNLSAIVSGQIVDSLYVVDSGNPVTVVANQQTTANLTFRQRAGTGRIWVAGNGGFSNGGRGSNTLPERNAAYSIADGSTTMSPFISPSADQSVWRIAFDREGNMYVMYQAGSTLSNSVVRISEANLRQFEASGDRSFLSPTRVGNARVSQDAFWLPNGSLSGETFDDPPPPTFRIEPADMAFDNAGNLWIVNDFQGSIACVTRSRLDTAAASGGVVGQFDQLFVGAGTNGYTPGGELRNSGSLFRPFMIPHNVQFDLSGNLWFTSGGYGGDSSGKRALLSRINASRATCAGGIINLNGSANQGVDISLDISLADTTTAGESGAIYKPVALALEPGGQALWVGDYGGATFRGDLSGGERDADARPDSAFRVPLSGSNVLPNNVNNGLNVAQVSHRVVVRDWDGGGINKGSQQVFGLAFDSRGYLWMASNNNVEVMTGDNLPLALTDRLGKLLRVRIFEANGSLRADLAGRSGGTADADQVISVPGGDLGVGLIGVAFNTPNPSSPAFLR